MKATLTIATIHGNRDKDAYHKFHLENEIKLGVPEEKRTLPVCDVLVILKNEVGDRLELHVRDWDEASSLKEGQKYDIGFTLVN